MAEFTEELEPLFDYRRVQPLNVVCLEDDDDEDEDVVYVAKKRKTCQPKVKSSPPTLSICTRLNAHVSKFLNYYGVYVENGKTDEKAVLVVDIEEKEDDWLPPPPKVSSDVHRTIGEDSTLKELRLKKQELVSFAQSAKDMLQTVEESAKRELDSSLQSSVDAVSEKTSKPPSQRVKIVISIQDKDELKQFRIYMDDNFERIFKMYADKVKLDLKHLVFSFDGDRISPSQTPSGLGMEDDDIIEVHVKSS